jgi:hypothetical protein
VAGLGLLERRVELVHLHDRVRPVEQVVPAVGGDSEELADDRDRVRLGEVAQQVEAAVGQQLVSELAHGPRSASTERGVNAAATSFRIRVCSGGSSQSRLQRSLSQKACQRGSSGSAAANSCSEPTWRKLRPSRRSRRQARTSAWRVTNQRSSDSS